MTHDSGTRAGEDIADAVDATLDDVTRDIRGKGREIGRKASESLEDGRAAAADGLRVAARSLHRRADSIATGAERVSRATHDMADRVDSASRYVRDNDARTMVADVEAMVRRHPARSILAVLAIGFLAGRALRDD